MDDGALPRVVVVDGADGTEGQPVSGSGGMICSSPAPFAVGLIVVGCGAGFRLASEARVEGVAEEDSASRFSRCWTLMRGLVRGWLCSQPWQGFGAGRPDLDRMKQRPGTHL